MLYGSVDAPEALSLSEARAREFEGLSKVSEDRLNFHIIEGHLSNPVTLQRVGLRFDAELAQHVGVSLEETASTIASLLAAMRTGGFSNTPTYRSMQSLRLAEILALPPSSSIDLVQSQLNTLYDYEEHLRAELQRLVNLGVADGQPGDLSINPTKADSFFAEFGVEPV